MTENNDIKVAFYVVTKATPGNPSVPVNLALLNDYHAYVYHECNGVMKLLATYKKNNTGMYAIDPDGVITNKATIVVNRELLRENDVKNLYLEVQTQMTATSDFINSLRNAGDTGIFITNIDPSVNKRALK